MTAFNADCNLQQERKARDPSDPQIAAALTSNYQIVNVGTPRGDLAIPRSSALLSTMEVRSKQQAANQSLTSYSGLN